MNEKKRGDPGKFYYRTKEQHVLYLYTNWRGREPCQKVYILWT